MSAAVTGANRGGTVIARRPKRLARRTTAVVPPTPPERFWTTDRVVSLALGCVLFVCGYLLPGPKPWTTREVGLFVAFPVVCIWSPTLADFLNRLESPRPRYPLWFLYWFGWFTLIGVNGVHQVQRWSGS